MVVATDLDEDKVKKVGGVQLNFPGTSLVLLDWKYNKEDHVVVIIVIVIAMVPPSFYSTGNKVRKTMSSLSLSLLWHLPHPTRLELQQDRPCNLYHCHCHCYDSSLILHTRLEIQQGRPGHLCHFHCHCHGTSLVVIVLVIVIVFHS